MLFVIFFFLAYLAPVVPVARRLAWKIHDRKCHVMDYVLPEREITQNVTTYSDYVYINDHIIEARDVCNNCGGQRNVHMGELPGLAKSSRQGTSDCVRYSYCDNFEKWDRKRMSWPETKIYKPDPDPKDAVFRALVESLFFWWWIVGSRTTSTIYRRIEPDWSGFAKPPAEVAKELRIKQLEETNDRLERELEIGPYSKDKV